MLQQGVKYQLVGLVLSGPGVLRNHQKVMVEGLGNGEITSGSFSPTLNKGIALARVPAGTGQECLVICVAKRYPLWSSNHPLSGTAKKRLAYDGARK